MEGDSLSRLEIYRQSNFNPLPPHGGRRGRLPIREVGAFHFNPLPPHGGRQGVLCRVRALETFQSTPSAWRETFHNRNFLPRTNHFNPLPPHGGRLGECVDKVVEWAFQSTPSAWRETYNFDNVFCVELFQSTPSAWRETSSCQWDLLRVSNFNPLPPHGGRQLLTLSRDDAFLFQSTPSAWRETHHFKRLVSVKEFQSTPSAWRETVV